MPLWPYLRYQHSPGSVSPHPCLQTQWAICARLLVVCLRNVADMMGRTGRGPAARVLPEAVWASVEALSLPGPAAVEHVNGLLAGLQMPAIGLRWYQRHVALRDEERGAVKRRMPDDCDDLNAVPAAKLPRATDTDATSDGPGSDAPAQHSHDESSGVEWHLPSLPHSSPRADSRLDDWHSPTHNPLHSPTHGADGAGNVAPDATVSRSAPAANAGTPTRKRALNRNSTVLCRHSPDR